jgi:hypothetical protein
VQFLLILYLGTRWGDWSASRPGRALPPGKGLPLPIGQEAGWAPELVWTNRLEEKSFASAGDRTSIQISNKHICELSFKLQFFKICFHIILAYTPLWYLPLKISD